VLVDLEVIKMKKAIGEYIYGFDEDLLEKVIGDLFIKRKMTVSSAESCTGGYIAYVFTTIPGSSEYYMGSVVAYQNKIKSDILNVKSETLEKYGAVSEQTVKEMAEGVRKKFGTDIGVSSSGIAGPSGGTEEKPVGTVWIALAGKEETITKKLMLGNDRDINVKRTTTAVFNLIRQSLTKNN
jgi:nicotinamide-nucleotide amidase